MSGNHRPIHPGRAGSDDLEVARHLTCTMAGVSPIWFPVPTATPVSDDP